MIKRALLIMAMVATGLDVKADERILVVPPQMYTDGFIYPEYIRYFRDDYQDTAHTQCQNMAVWVHRSRIAAPHFSACIHPAELVEIRR